MANRWGTNGKSDRLVITDLEPDILECEVKWALESITMCGRGRGWEDLGEWH